MSKLLKNQLNEERENNLNYFLTYFANLNTIKNCKKRFQELSPKNYAEVDYMLDTEIKMNHLKKYCIDFYKNVLVFLPLQDIYFLKLRYYRKLSLPECSQKLGFVFGPYDNAQILSQYIKILNKWLNKTKQIPA